jgi:uncharacterized protein (DUF1697 family)
MKPDGSSSVYVALLRAVNVGGNNIVSMKALKASFERLAVADVQTYINSGNVLFRAKDTDARTLEDRIDRMLVSEHGLKGKTVVRSAADMARLVKTIDEECKPDPEWRLNVIFLRHTLDPTTVAASLELKSEIERIVCCPGTLLWSARTSSLTRTAMVKLSSRPIYQEMTVRGVNTTRKILELMKRMMSIASPDTSPQHDRGGRVTRAAGVRAQRRARRP